MFLFWVQSDESRKTNTQHVISTAIKILNNFILPKHSTCPSPGDLQPLLSDPRNPISSSSSYIFVFLKFYINRMYSMYLFVWLLLLSRLFLIFNHIAYQLFIFFFFPPFSCIIYHCMDIQSYLSVYLLMDIYIVSIFWLVWLRIT